MRELLYEASRVMPHVRLFRRNVLRLKMIDSRGKDRMVIAGIKGQCDLWGVVWGGLHLEIELKSENGRLTIEQKTWRDWCLLGQIPWMCLWPWPNETREETVQRWVAVVAMMAGPVNGTLSAQVPALDETGRTSARGKRRKAQPSPTRST